MKRIIAAILMIMLSLSTFAGAEPLVTLATISPAMLAVEDVRTEYDLGDEWDRYALAIPLTMPFLIEDSRISFDSLLLGGIVDKAKALWDAAMIAGSLSDIRLVEGRGTVSILPDISLEEGRASISVIYDDAEILYSGAGWMDTGAIDGRTSASVDFKVEPLLTLCVDADNTLSGKGLIELSFFLDEERVDEYLAENPLDPAITTKTGGMGELLNDSIVPMMQAGLIGLFLVYMVMVLVFERFKHPMLIMLTIPFCAIGVLLSLSVFGSSMNMVSIMGVITLFGMLVNNGIILVDYINQLQEERRAEKLKERGIAYDEVDGSFGLLPYDEELKMLKENIKEGTTSRLRPILMSSLTTILGVIPMAIAKGEGAEVYAPLGQVIMGGLTTSTFITLIIMPIFYFRSERRRMNRKYNLRRGK